MPEIDPRIPPELLRAGFDAMSSGKGDSEKITDIIRATLKWSAEVALLAPGQDWSDETTPGQMAKFIAEAILGFPEESVDTGPRVS